MQRTQDLDHVESPPNPSDERKGSILVIVIALLGMLLLLGIAFYSFAAQEHVSASYFAEAMKVSSGPPVDVLFDYGLDQLIVGPSNTQPQSVLYGRRHSLMGNLLGVNDIATGKFDSIPHNGVGAHLIMSGGLPVIDNDLDGAADVGGGTFGFLLGQKQLDFNTSAAANGGTAVDTNSWSSLMPDVDYTYPDINNPFLAHVVKGADDVNAIPRNIIIPSFHRPQYMRDATGTVKYTAAPGTNWWEDPALKARTFRPHPEHVIEGTTTPRFIRHSTANPSSVYGSDTIVSNVLGSEIEPFPFKVGNGEMGVWTDTTPTDATHAPYEFDTDNDNDGIKEGVWLDIDFPAQTLIDGRRYVPLFSFTVQDANGLINLNTAGNLNLADNTYLDASTSNMQNQPISTSNLGVSRSEVNPMWGLWGWSTGTLTAAQKKEYRFFLPGSNPTALDGSMTRTAIANMEMIHLKNGQKRDNGVGGDEYNIGEWGELSTLQAGGFASPGRAAFDDDGDENTGLLNSDPLLQIASSNFPRVGHPLDLRGMGLMTSTTLADGSTAANGLVRHLVNGPSGNPTQFVPNLHPSYRDYLDGSQLEVYQPTLFTGSAQTLTDDADETVVDPLLADSTGALGASIDADAVYGADEMLGLHLTNTEYTSVAGTSRLRNLAPINFADDELRKQFTTMSFDEAVYGAPLSLKRVWEWPFIATIPGYRPEVGVAHMYRFRLGLNGLIVGNTPIDANNQRRPIYRALTPHPETGLGNTPITTPSGGIVEPPVISNANDREFYARYDRQRLAHDIYVLLYMGGGGLDVCVNNQAFMAISEVAGTTIYTDAQLREMAQFAVNLVDSMDRDNIITRFEYDRDMSVGGGGWSLDDNPYTTTDGGTDRAEVYGVEAQQLTLSEFQAIRTKILMADSNLTQWDDQNERIFSLIELRNSSPAAVDLGSQSWQIQIKTDPAGSTANLERRLVLKSGTVTAGSTFLIAGYSADDLPHPTDPTNSRAPSQFMANFDGGATDWSSSQYRIAPLHSTIDLDLVPSNKTDTDLSTVTTHELHEKPASSTSQGDGIRTNTIGDFISPTLIDPSNPNVTVILRRRMNPYRTQPTSLGVTPTGMEITDHDAQAADNPWIEVDRVRITATNDLVNLPQFATPETPTFADVQTALTTLNGSSEHKEPFDPQRVDGKITTDTVISLESRAPYAKNSFGGINEATKDISVSGSDSFTLWQPHFDREFSSIIDLFSIPLYGPENVTRFLKPSFDMTQSVFSITNDNADLGVELVAGTKFLRPDSAAAIDPTPITLPPMYTVAPYNYPSGTANVARWDNHWHRVLEHLEVPNQTNRQIQWKLTGGGTSAIQWPDTSLPRRLPGSLNLNSIRHRSVLAGLIDDPDDPTTLTAKEGHLNPTIASTLVDKFEPARDWWVQFVTARDRIDPVTTLILPGLPGSRPFRSLSYTDENSTDPPGTSVQHTILRDLPIDSAAGLTRRNLFEARASSSTAEVDYHTRHRLLQKVANNAATRGNVFIVWMTVGFFEAADDTASGKVRIGAQLSGLPEHRGFFVVDRTLIEEASIQSSLYDHRFDYKKFITYRKTLK